MATQVVMPKLSPTMEEGQISRWLKQEGDKVAIGEGLAEIDTDKATMEAQALSEGVLRKIIVKEGESVPLGNIIAIIGEPDEDISALLGVGGKDENNKDTATKPETSKPELSAASQDDKATANRQASSAGAETSSKAETANAPANGNADAKMESGKGESNAESTNGRVIVSPLAARMAAEAGLNLNALKGTGPQGRIVKRDIEEAIKSGANKPTASEAVAQSAAATAQVEAPQDGNAPSAVETTSSATSVQTATAMQTPDVQGASSFRDVANTEMRRTIARRLTSSIGPVPHFFLTTEIEMERALELRKQLNELDTQLKISVNDMIIKVAAAALIAHPQVNASYQDQNTRYYNQADIGVAVALPDGLITPVIRRANTKSIGAISREIRELAERARNRKLKPEEYTGATFSVSNLGKFGIDEFTAVINPPEAAILAVGAATPQAVVREGEIVVRNIMRVTMSCDHRVIDGATGAEFLQTFKQIMENPLRLLA